nr:immunoglobulin light chain junction region [Macaca mulatta]MOX29178.1 immunoglobulin light chain junction region [Macaca mulatta]MOX29483.1 immunoglobulin light chain junction region [Macaca mulatta]MOX30248.1 immunoglobulin light chain junction region [Macaca mulatta]MOX30628.1 immunoglobulin light chain junction region [Macaca mulatta]
DYYCQSYDYSLSGLLF